MFPARSYDDAAAGHRTHSVPLHDPLPDDNYRHSGAPSSVASLPVIAACMSRIRSRRSSRLSNGSPASRITMPVVGSPGLPSYRCPSSHATPGLRLIILRQRFLHWRFRQTRRSVASVRLPCRVRKRNGKCRGRSSRPAPLRPRHRAGRRWRRRPAPRPGPACPGRGTRPGHRTHRLLPRRARDRRRGPAGGRTDLPGQPTHAVHHRPGRTAPRPDPDGRRRLPVAGAGRGRVVRAGRVRTVWLFVARKHPDQSCDCEQGS